MHENAFFWENEHRMNQMDPQCKERFKKLLWSSNDDKTGQYYKRWVESPSMHENFICDLWSHFQQYKFQIPKVLVPFIKWISFSENQYKGPSKCCN